MIVLAWSLVSSVIEAARRRRLAIYLRQFLDDAENSRTMLLCRKIMPLFSSSSFSQLVRFTSDSQLNNYQTLYRNERIEVVIQAAEPIGYSEWRFVPYAIGEVHELRIHFAAYSCQFQSAGNCHLGAADLSGCAVFLESCCERVAWHRLKPASIYSCSFDRFVDIVYAFSEGALYENNTTALIDSLHTILLSDVELFNSVASSLGSSRTQIVQRPLPLLEQLFWGDTHTRSRLRERFSSESTLLQIHNGSFGSLSRRYCTSSRRRYRSYTYDSVRPYRDRHTGSLSSAPRFFDSTDLPPFIRFLEFSSRPSSARSFVDQMPRKPQRNLQEDMVLSSSVTIDELDQKSDMPDLKDDIEIPYVDDSDTTTSPQPMIEGSKYAAVIRQKDSFNGDILMEYSKDHDKLEFKRVTETVIDNDSWKLAELPPLPHCAQNRISMRQHKTCGHEEGESWSYMHSISRRRHSIMASPISSTTIGEQSARYRSLSPIPHEFFRRRSIHTSLESSLIDRSIFARDPFPRPYTPTRKFHANNNQLPKAMYKPPSILVYTGSHTQLYSRIRESLAKIIPIDRYTVFNISLEAIRKQPWIEATTACFIIADTSDLDDLAWTKMQIYFNQAGKIIFVCQNRLLASLTNCDSMKKQADILRMAFGSRDSISMGKDFEHFLKKSLKSLTKQGQVNETFHSKDLAGGMSYSVVLTKTSDLPLLLYMENSAHQASAIFSDATSEQLLAPGKFSTKYYIRCMQKS